MPEELLWTEGLLSDGRTPQENEGGLENWASMKTGSHGLTRKAWEDNGALPWFARGEFLILLLGHTGAVIRLGPGHLYADLPHALMQAAGLACWSASPGSLFGGPIVVD